MALIKAITRQALQTHNPHTEVECTYDIVQNPIGTKSLQLDTYGSKQRQLKGQKSQSLRLSPSAIADLKAIIQANNL